MTMVLERAGASDAELIMDMPFYSAEQLGNSQHACAAMMLAGAFGEVPFLNDRQAMAAFTGVASDTEQYTTGARALQSFSERGAAVTIIGQTHYQGFSRYGAKSLAASEAAAFGLLEPWRQQSEQYSASLLVDKLAERRAYENRQAVPDDIRKLCAAGWLVKLTVNGRQLQGEPGFRQLPLVVVAADQEKLTVHNPGNGEVTASPDQALQYDELQAAWGAAGFMLQAIGRVRQSGSAYYA